MAEFVSGRQLRAKRQAARRQQQDNRQYISDKIEGTVDYFRKKVEGALSQTQEDTQMFPVQNVGDIRTRGMLSGSTLASTLLSPIGDIVSTVTPDVVKEKLSQGKEYLADTDVGQAVTQAVEENPRAARLAEAYGDVVGLLPAARVAKAAINEPVLSMNTMIPENYSGIPGSEAYGSIKTFGQAVPRAILGAFNPKTQAAIRQTGISPYKAAGEIGEGVSQGNQSYGSALTSALLSRQTGRGESLVEAGPIGKSSFHGVLKGSDTDGLRNSIFIDNKNTRGSIPSQVQDRALNHLIQNTGVGAKLKQTDVFIKRNFGYDVLGTEGLLGTKASLANPVMSALNSGSSLKGSLNEWVKRNKIPRGKKGDESVVEAARKDLSSSDMEEYFQYYNETHPNTTPVNFRKGEGDDPFYYFQSSHNSRAKELGGVNMFFAMNPKTGQLITMISDRHDLMKRDPVGGTPAITVSPAQISNFKAIKGQRFTLNRKKKQEQDTARKEEQEQAADEVEKRTGVKRGETESPVAYHIRAMKEFRPRAEAQDYGKVGTRVGMLTAGAQPLVGAPAAAAEEER